MKLVKKEDGTIVQVLELESPVTFESFDAKISGLNTSIENLKKQVEELEVLKKDFEKLNSK